MNKPQILIVEDDNAVANLISATLETQDYAYKRAATGAGAVMEALSCKPDVVLLDLGLPDMDGVEIIKKIRSWSNMPIIVVSARSEDFDKVSALDAGADDYLTKPFPSMSCLRACALHSDVSDTTVTGSARNPAHTKTAICVSTIRPAACIYPTSKYTSLR